MRRPDLWAALAVLLLAQPAVAQRPPAAAFHPAEESETDYPDAPGREETFGFCTACHGFKIVAAQGMTRLQWDESLKWMVLRHNMPEHETADRDIILGYLEKAFPPKATSGRPGWQNPFAPAR